MPRKAQPVKVPTGTPYGGRQALANSEKALPLPTAPPPPSGAVTPGGPATAAGGPGGQAGVAGALTALGQMQPMGPMQGGTDTTNANVAQPITTMPPAPVDSAMAKYLPALETAANMPNASWVLRQFVRRLRASTPASTDLGNPAQVNAGGQ